MFEEKLNCSNMRLNKPKSNQKPVMRTYVLVLMAALFLCFITPVQAKAVMLGNALAYLPVFSQISVLTNAFLAQLSQAPDEPETLPLSGEREPSKTVEAVITAYTSTVDQCDDDPFIAASGKRVYDGMLAANWLPFGTKVKIPSLFGDKIFTVDDRMNSRYGYGRMDVWLDTTRAEAKKFGVKRVKIEIYYK